MYTHSTKLLPSAPVTRFHNLPNRTRLQICCSSKPQIFRKNTADTDSEPSRKASGIAAATLAASILLASVAVPGDALAARSGGRAGGSSFRSAAPRAAPRSAPRSGPSISNRSYNYNINPSPPLIGGYGGGYGYGYGGGGISLFPTFVSPVGGGLFQLFFFAIIASTVVGVVRSFLGSGRQRDEWDD